MVPQHRRGGKHAVKDEDLTHTKYDDYNREQLLAAVKEAGCYVKDEKKSVMARKLAEHDRNKQHEERRAAQEQKVKEEARQQEMTHASKAQRDRRSARAKRNEERSTLCERGRNDETWEGKCSSITARSTNPPAHPSCRLQLFEWSYPHSPPNSPPSSPDAEQHPARLAYAPLKLITTATYQKITLPGRTYPAGVDLDYAPTLDTLTRAAARHGHLLNQFSRAVLEPASLWAARTTAQGWNGRMYFALPAQSQRDTKTVTLDEVYRNWHAANATLLRPTPGVEDVKADRQRRVKQRARNKQRRVAEVYEASLWRPKAVGYWPSFLDWEAGAQDSAIPDRSKTIENLWYVRFLGCDLPHYYFWAAREWADPARPDPGWSVERVLTSSKFRVKRLTAPPVLVRSPCKQSFGFEDTLRAVEDHLVRIGLSATLTSYRARSIAAGKGRAWTSFSHTVPRLVPNGKLPRVPPVKPTNDLCIAAKIALLLDGQDVAPYTGKESWTRNYDSFWDVVSDSGREDTREADGDGLTDTQDPPRTVPITDAAHEQIHALHRRDSFKILPPSTSDKHILTWLASIESTHAPPSVPLSPDPVDVDDPVTSLDPNPRGASPTCPFCSHAWTKLADWERAAHMLSHSRGALPSTSLCGDPVFGAGAKRRHSMLSHTTLQSYHRKYARRGDAVRGDAARSRAGSLASSLAESVRERVVERVVMQCRKGARETSPYSKERRRRGAMSGLQVGCGQGRGGRGWMLERAQSDWGSEDGDEDEINLDMDIDGCDEESVWFGDDEG
ncbi:hypothetical protein E8E12_002517 [Didymella heteroderae]|uniref:Uncharacterized protein n=1 Tax=Didymella heteroderae TaxID=1769908 RepID=A0A9P4WIH6_9PLEO|nr:hypothetical protein E8E12_002517 [Didymella heteroderae]